MRAPVKITLASIFYTVLLGFAAASIGGTTTYSSGVGSGTVTHTIDNFNDGDYSGWEMEQSCYTTDDVRTITGSYEGSHAFQIRRTQYQGCAGGPAKSFDSVYQPNKIVYWARLPDDNARAHLYVQKNDTQGITGFDEVNLGQYGYNLGGSGWRKIEVKFDWSTREYRMYIDGSHQGAHTYWSPYPGNIPSGVNTVGRIAFRQRHGDSTDWFAKYDDIRLVADNNAPEFTSMNSSPVNWTTGSAFSWNVSVSDRDDNLGAVWAKMEKDGTEVKSWAKATQHSQDRYGLKDFYTPSDSSNYTLKIKVNDTLSGYNISSTEQEVKNVGSQPVIGSLSPADINQNPGGGVELDAEIGDADGDLMNLTFYDASDDSEIGTVENVGNGTYTATWTGLSEDSTYSWYTEVTDGTSTVQSSTVSFTTIGVTLNWNDQSSNEGGFRIYNNASGSIAEAGTAPADAEAFTDYSEGLEFGKNYTYQLASFNEYGESSRVEGYVVPSQS